MLCILLLCPKMPGTRENACCQSKGYSAEFCAQKPSICSVVSVKVKLVHLLSISSYHRGERAASSALLHLFLSVACPGCVGCISSCLEISVMGHGIAGFRLH